MNKIKTLLLGVTLAHFTTIYAQDCSTTPASSKYNKLEVYERGVFKGTDNLKRLDLSVHIDTRNRIIKLIDTTNSLGGEFFILDCIMRETDLVYECLDIKNKRMCHLTFSADKSDYILTVEYEVQPIIYRVKRTK